MSLFDQILTEFFSFFVIFTILGFAYSFLLVVRSNVIHKKEEEKVNPEATEDMVTVIVPMYNEEKTILRTLEEILMQSYAGKYEVILVDDGSTDSTVELVLDKYGASLEERSFNPQTGPYVKYWESAEGSTDTKLKLITKPNGGKASALNMGAEARAITSKWILSVDGDTILDRDALQYLVYYRKPEADAIASMVGIANGNDMTNGAPEEPKLPKKFWERVQWLEYMKGYATRACALKDRNCISVIPGACSFISVDMVEKTGGYKENHLGEDMDHTLAIHEAGGYVQFMSKILSWTEAPDNRKDLGKQRVRWYRGAWQSYRGHMKLLFSRKNPTYGFLMLPLVWAFDVFGAWIEVLAWIFGIYTAVTGAYDLTFFLILWAVIIFMHYVNLILTIQFAKNKLKVITEPPSIAPIYGVGAVEGFFHHYLYVYWVLKAHVLEWFGAKKKWNKIERKGF